MTLMVYGLNHKTANLDMRGQLSFTPDEIERALQDIQASIADFQEVAMLVTCNRTEIHASSLRDTTEPIRDWLANNRRVSPKQLDEVTYSRFDDEAVRHIMEVASGMDSQILGETQIHGQLKTAYRIAQEAGTIGPDLNLVHEFTMQTAKSVRTDTKIGVKPASVASATIAMAKQIFTDIRRVQILLIGAGSNIQLITQHLQAEGTQHVTFANRTLENAVKLAEPFSASVLSLDSLAEQLHKFDMVVSSTASPHHILSENDVKQAIQERRHKPMFIADLAVPRDIEASANELRDTYLYSVDDLSQHINDSQDDLNTVLAQARRIVQEGIACYKQKRKVQLSGDILKKYRQQVDEARDLAISKAHRKLSTGETSEAVIAELATELANRLAHLPMVTLRRASVLDNGELLTILQDVLFEDDSSSVL